MKILIPDIALINSMEDMEIKQGEITRYGDPILRPEYPWEEIHAYLYGSVLKKGRLYRMWYQSYVDRLGFFVNYARSRDGVKWEKPLIKNFQFGGELSYPTVMADHEDNGDGCFNSDRSSVRLKTNIVSDYHIPSVIYDSEDKKHPYKLFGYTDRGYCAAFSRDGIHFREYENNPVIPQMRFPNPHTRKTWLSDVSPVFKDLRKNKFVAFVKTYIIDEEGKTRRCVGYSESRDFLSWTKPETIWVPTKDEDRLAIQKGFKWADFYGLCGFNYGDIYLGLLWLFYIDYEFEKGTHEGKIEVYLAHSPDGRQWRRLSDEPFIDLNKSGWDTGMITTANIPIFEEDRMLIYYGGANISHGMGHPKYPYDFRHHRFNTGMASLGRDRFSCLTSQKGSFVTRPLKCEKGLIRVNADTRGGRISVSTSGNGKEGGSFRMEGINSKEFIMKTGMRGGIVLKVDIEGARLYSLEVL